MDWLKEHPYLAGVAVLAAVVLYFVLQKSGGSSGGIAVTGPSDAILQAQISANTATEQAQTAQNAHTQDLEAALQQQILQGRSAVDLATTTGATQEQLAQLANQGTAQQIAGAVSIAGITTGGAIQQTQIQSSTAESLATTQADVQAAEIQAQLDAQLNDNSTAESINSTNNQTAIQQAQLQQVVSLTSLQDQLNAILNTNATQLSSSTDSNKTALQINSQNVARDSDLATINADTSTTVASLNAGVQNNAIQANATVQEQTIAEQLQAIIEQVTGQLQAQSSQEAYQTQTIAGVNSNLGGLSQTNRAALFQTELGAPSTGAVVSSSSNAASAAGTSALFQFLSTLVNGATKITGAVFG